MPKITADIPTSLNSALNAEIARSKTEASSIVTAALAQYLKTPVHTLFQVSTSGALVAGVYSGAVSVESLLQHGDFGLGTFADLDGEMVVLDRHVYQVQGTGRVSEAPPTASAPFAVVTRFSPETDLTIGSITNFTELQKRCDGLRTSGNIFYAFRLDGTFKRIRTRAVSPPEEGARLIDAAKAQSEFRFTDVSGTPGGIVVSRVFERLQYCGISLPLPLRRPPRRRTSLRLRVRPIAPENGSINRFPSRVAGNGEFSQSRPQQKHRR